MPLLAMIALALLSRGADGHALAAMGPYAEGGIVSAFFENFHLLRPWALLLSSPGGGSVVGEPSGQRHDAAAVATGDRS